jgi:hypothetical protein
MAPHQVRTSPINTRGVEDLEEGVKAGRAVPVAKAAGPSGLNASQEMGRSPAGKVKMVKGRTARAKECKLKVRPVATKLVARKTRGQEPMVRGKLAKAKTEILAAGLLRAAKVQGVAAAGVGSLGAKVRAATFSSCN